MKAETSGLIPRKLAANLELSSIANKPYFPFRLQDTGRL